VFLTIAKRWRRIHSGTAFKIGMTLAYIVATVLLFVFMYTAFMEYDGSSFESIGFTMVVTCGAIGSGVMLFGLYAVLKLKSLTA
jgi:hypothetical protein